MTTTQLAALVQLSPARLRAILKGYEPPGMRRTKGGHFRFRNPSEHGPLKQWIADMQPGRPLRVDVCGRQSWKPIVTDGMTKAQLGAAAARLKPTLSREDIIRDASLSEKEFLSEEEFRLLTHRWKGSKKVRVGSRTVYPNTLHLRKWIHRIRTNPEYKKELLDRAQNTRRAIKKALPSGTKDWMIDIHRHCGCLVKAAPKPGAVISPTQAFLIRSALRPVVDLIARLDAVERAQKPSRSA